MTPLGRERAQHTAAPRLCLGGRGLHHFAIQHVVEHIQKARDVEGLREVVARPHSEKTFYLQPGGVRADHYDGDVGRAGILLKPGEDVGSRGVRKVQVEQDQVGWCLRARSSPKLPCIAASSRSSGRCASTRSTSLRLDALSSM